MNREEQEQLEEKKIFYIHSSWMCAVFAIVLTEVPVALVWRDAMRQRRRRPYACMRAC